MEVDADKLIMQSIKDGITQGLKERLSRAYNSPLDKIIASALERNFASFSNILDEAIKSCIGDEDFRKKVAEAVREKLARTLIQRFGGEMEKQVNGAIFRKVPRDGEGS